MNIGTSVISVLMTFAVAVCSLSTRCGAENARTDVGAAQDLLACMRTLARDPQYAEISAKLPLQDMNTISFGMLADRSRPTPQERKEIASWFDERDQCWKTHEATLQAQWPPELFQLSNEGSAGVKSIGVELYNGKISFGEANKQIQQLGNSIKARIIPIVKQYQADIAAQKAEAEQRDQQRQDASERRIAQQQAYQASQANQEAAQANQAEALRTQRAQLFLNYLRANQQPAQLPQLTPSRTTNCQTFGNSTNCITR